jgi:hypothetical protein
MEPTALDPVRYRLTTHPEGEQLPAGNDAMLIGGQRPRRRTPRLRTLAVHGLHKCTLAGIRPLLAS